MKKILFMGEGAGLYTKGFMEKSKAVFAMRREAQREYDISPIMWDEYYHFTPEQITEESVVLTWYYQHRSCGTETIGDDNICFECGESCGTRGRRTFAFISEI